jgi:hypothetical protein
LGKSHITALILGILTLIYWIGNGMQFGNTAHDFYANYLSNITPNQFQQQIIAWAYGFLFQQQITIIGTTAIPVIALIVVVAGLTAYGMSRR